MIRSTKLSKTEYHFYQVEDKLPLSHLDMEEQLLFLYNIDNGTVPILSFHNFMQRMFLYCANSPIDNTINKKIPMTDWIEVDLDLSRMVLDVKQYSGDGVSVAGASLDHMGIIKYWGIKNDTILEFLINEWEVQ